jgi:hypothetical protein
MDHRRKEGILIMEALEKQRVACRHMIRCQLILMRMENQEEVGLREKNKEWMIKGFKLK